MTVKITMAVDYLDLVWHSEELFDEAKIDNFVAQCAEKGVDELQWRVSALGDLLYHSSTPDRYRKDISNIEAPNAHSGRKALTEKLNTIMESFDPLEAACRSARKHGLRIVPWLTLFDDHGPLGTGTSSFVRSNPEKCWKAYDGKGCLPGILSYAWQESVEFRMKQIRELLDYDANGIYLSNRTHSRPPEYNLQAKNYLEENPESNMREFNQKNPSLLPNAIRTAIHQFGFDKPAVDAYLKQYGKEASPDDMDWWRFRGKYFENFLKKVRYEVDKKGGVLGFGLRFTDRDEEHTASLSGLNFFPENFFDWESYLTNRIIDEAHYKVDSQTAFPELYPETACTKPEQRMGWFWLGTRNFDERKEIGLRVLKAVEDNSIGGVVLFEAHSPLYYDKRHWDWIKIFRGQ